MGRRGNSDFFNYNNMGDTKTTIWQEIGQAIPKFMMAGAYIAIGLVAKFAIDSRDQKLTRTQLLGKGSISFMVGFISFVACRASGHIEWAGVVTPASTMLGETIAVYIFSHLTGWLDWLTEKLKKKTK